MSVFKLPKSLCNDLHSLIRKLWWSSNDKERGMAWISWERMCRPKENGGMGFKDLPTFNQALLAKQGWRLIQHPNSLLSKVLKSRYFPRKDFLNTRVGRNPSYAWRSILFGRELLSKGLRWRVGDGKRIKIVKDPWLLAQGNFKVITPLHFINDQMKVAELLQQGHWKTELIPLLFCQRDIELILKVPLCKVGGEDKMFWHYTTHGCFTVSSAYKLGLQKHMESLATSSASILNWNVIWKCKLPPKVQIFAWQHSNNGIASGTNLCRRGIKVSPRCARCSHPMEDDLHIFFHCEFAQKAWRGLSLKPYKWLPRANSWLHLFHVIIEGTIEPYQTLGKFIICLWGLWQSRNSWVFSGERHNASDVMKRALELLELYQLNEGANKTPVSTAINHAQCWRPTDAVLNTDASFACSGAGFGFILRNHKGEIILSGDGPLTGIISAEHAEVMALWRGLDHIRNIWSRNVVCEVVQQLSTEETNLSTLGGILESLKTFIATTGVLSISFFPRTSNRAAHNLAKIGHSLTSEIIWYHTVPPSIMDTLNSEWFTNN